MITPDFTTRRKARRVRGFRISFLKLGHYHTLPIVWSDSTPLQQWQAITSDETVTQAVMRKSGRKFLTYSKQEGNHEN